MTATLETLAAVFRIAKVFMFADDRYSEEEAQPLYEFLSSFEGIDEAAVDQISTVADELELTRAVELIAGMDDEGKQEMANLFARIIVSDEDIADVERALYWKVRNLCGLPGPKADGSDKQAA